MNEDAVWAILASELNERGPMSGFIERSGAKLVDRPLRRASYHIDAVQRAALRDILGATAK